MSQLFAGRYEIEEKIGQGGMGQVLRARDQVLGRPVAIKTLVAGIPDSARVRFIEEAQITGQLAHPYIIAVHELGVDQDQFYLAMKLIEGRDLKDIIEGLSRRKPSFERRYPLRLLLRLFLKVCEAMAFAHEKEVVHRDLKPANIMFGDSDNDEVLVMDWGLAKPIDKLGGLHRSQVVSAARQNILESARSSGTSPELTQEGAVVGTPIYMSPEQAENPARVDHRTDIYALGAILYEILTHKRPYEGSTFQVLNKLFKGPPKDPSVVAPERDIPPPLEAIVKRAMARDGLVRYDSAMDLAKDIEAFLDNRRVSAYSEDFVEIVKRVTRQNKALLATVVLLLIILSVGLSLSYTWVSNKESQAANALLKSKISLADAELQSWKAKARKPIQEFDQEVANALREAYQFVRRSKSRLNAELIRSEYNQLSESIKNARSKIIEQQKNAVADVETGGAGPKSSLSILQDAKLEGCSEETQERYQGLLKTVNDEGRQALRQGIENDYNLLIQELTRANNLIEQALALGYLARNPNKLDALLPQLNLGVQADILLTRMRFREHRFDKARAILAKLLKQAEGQTLSLTFRNMIKVLEALLRKSPKALTIEEKLKTINKALKDDRERRDPNNPDIEGPAWLFMRRAELYAQLGEFHKARVDYRRAIGLNTRDSAIHISELRYLLEPYATWEGTQPIQSFFRSYCDFQVEHHFIFQLSAIGLVKRYGPLADPKVRQRASVLQWGHYFGRAALRKRDASKVLDLLEAMAAEQSDHPDVFAFRAENSFHAPENFKEEFKRSVNAAKRGIKAEMDWLEKNRAKLSGLTGEAKSKLEGAIDTHQSRLRDHKQKLFEAQSREQKYAPWLQKSRQDYLREVDEYTLRGLQQYPDHGRLNFIRGEYLAEQKMFREAIPYYQVGVRGSMSPTRHYRMALCCLATRDPVFLKKGIEAIRRALRFDDVAFAGRQLFPGELNKGSHKLHECYGDLHMALNQAAPAALHYLRAQTYLFGTKGMTRQQMIDTKMMLTLKLGDAHRDLNMPAVANSFYQQVVQSGGPLAAKARRKMEGRE